MFAEFQNQDLIFAERVIIVVNVIEISFPFSDYFIAIL
jgi:hypothetical protein